MTGPGIDSGQRDNIAALQRLAPLDRNDALALTAALTGLYSIRELADLMHELSGTEWLATCTGVLGVLVGQIEVPAADVTRMRDTAVTAGWRPVDRRGHDGA